MIIVVRDVNGGADTCRQPCLLSSFLCELLMLRLLELLELLSHFLALHVGVCKNYLVAASHGWRFLLDHWPPIQSQGTRLHNLLGEARTLHLY